VNVVAKASFRRQRLVSGFALRRAVRIQGKPMGNDLDILEGQAVRNGNTPLLF